MHDAMTFGKPTESSCVSSRHDGSTGTVCPPASKSKSIRPQGMNVAQVLEAFSRGFVAATAQHTAAWDARAPFNALFVRRPRFHLFFGSHNSIRLPSGSVIHANRP